MSRRIEIELTSARPDGTWTWRAAGARSPKGVLDGSLLPADAQAGWVLKADAETVLDGITILSVSTGKEKAAKTGVLELITSDKPFEAVTQQLAKRDRNDRDERGPRRDRPPRRDGAPSGDRRPPRRDGDAPRSSRPAGDRPGGDRTDRGPRPDRGPRQGGRSRPNFAAPPELPQRPKPKRLRPGRVHRNAVLADLPEEQRPVAERALQGGIPAVRQAVNEQNARLKSEGKDQVPAAGLLAMAEQLLPRLRVAEWLDRADAAKADLDDLDLRDLRSVVAAAEDPMVSRDETTRVIAAELKQALITNQERELILWFEDIDAAIGVGRVIRALKLSSQPPKAGIRFPTELAGKLSAATTANLTADALPDRWTAVLEAAAFSPIRTQVQATEKPTQINDELLATVKRVAPLLPQIAALFGIEAPQGASAPKPLRPTRPAPPKKPAKAPTPPTAAKASAKPPKATAPAVEPVVVAAEEAVATQGAGEEVAASDHPAEPIVEPVAAAEEVAASDHPAEPVAAAAEVAVSASAVEDVIEPVVAAAEAVASGSAAEPVVENLVKPEAVVEHPTPAVVEAAPEVEAAAIVANHSAVAEPEVATAPEVHVETSEPIVADPTPAVAIADHVDSPADDTAQA
jgi:hypothetical protein